jgi:polyisoprenoid-binding protein YceI
MTSTTATQAASGSRTTWSIDPAHSSVEFSAKHMMITTVKGRFAEVEGTIVTDDENLANSTVEATLRTASLDTRSEQRDQHLRSGDFLDTEQFPAITFRSSRIDGKGDQFKLTGDLTIHGVTRPITLDVTFEGRNRDPWGGERSGFSATGKLDRREWGLTWNQALETGGLLVSTEIKIQIDVQAVRLA